MKKLARICLCLVLLLPILTVSVFADTGPKPSVVIDFDGFGDEEIYATLLSERESSGPYSWVGIPDSYKEGKVEYPEIWDKFVDYQDGDGFYFLQYLVKCSDDVTLNWNYYPPERFKVLVYLPESDTFLVSEDVLDQYAFDSYFTVTKKSDDSALLVDQGSGRGWEVLAFLLRLALTLAVEMGIALLFGYRNRKQLLIIAAVNVVTQIGLNVGLMYGGYSAVFFGYILKYVVYELFIIIVEYIIYKAALRRCEQSEEKKRYPFMYALCANTASFLLGYVIAKWLPVFF